MFKKLLLLLFLAAVLLGGLAYWLVYWFPRIALELPADEYHYVVAPGSSLSFIARDLAAYKITPDARFLMLYSRISGRGQNIRVGEYAFSRGVTIENMLAKFERGDVVQYPITIVEGSTLRQLLAQLKIMPKLRATKDLQVDGLAETIGVKNALGLNLEGQFFPDTYYYYFNMSATELLLQSYTRMQKVLEEEWAQKQPNLPYNSAYQALIMASIIEKETGDPSERGQIAGVFVRRLERGMRLQTDPTVIYGLGADFDGNIRSAHLKDQNNRYNTYRHSGLPPSPIALPGRAAIHAALHPEPGESLYFVAKGDGSHYFSDTINEHQQAVKKFQIHHRAKNYSSAPAAVKP